MARLPTSLNVSRRTVDGTVGIDTSNADYGVGQLAQVADRFAQRERGIQQKRSAFQSAQADAEFLRVKLEQDNAYDQDDDYGTIEDRYSASMKEGLDKAASRIEDGAARNEFMLRNQLRLEQGRQGIKKLVFAKDKDASRAEINEQLNGLRDVAIGGDVATAGETAKEIFDNAVDLGYYSAEEAVTTRRTWSRDTAIERLKTLDIDEQESELAKPWAQDVPAGTRKTIERGIAAERKRRRTEARKEEVINLADAWKDEDLSVSEAMTRAESIEDPALRTSVESRYITLFNRDRAIEQEAQSERNAELRVGLIDGEVGRADIDAAYEAGEIGDGHWSSLVAASQIKVKKQSNAAIGLELLKPGGGPIDPYDTDHKKAIDAAFVETGADKKLAENFEAGMQGLVGFIETSGIVPKSAVPIIRGRALSGTIEQQAAGLDAIAKIYERGTSAAEAAFRDDDISEALSYQHKLQMGMEPEEAVERIQMERESKRSDPQKTLIRAARKESAKFDVKDVKSALDQSFFIGGEYDVSGGAQAELAAVDQYAKAFEDNFILHGDADLAKKQAKALMERTWGKTNVGGKRIMAYPPEKYYPQTSDKKWMRKQFEKETKDLGKSSELVSDVQTAREAQAGLPPTYAVITEDKDGVLSYHPDRFKFDPKDAIKKQTKKNILRREEMENRHTQNMIDEQTLNKQKESYVEGMKAQAEGLKGNIRSNEDIQRSRVEGLQ